MACSKSGRDGEDGEDGEDGVEWSGVVSCRVVCLLEKGRERNKHSRSSDEGG